MIEVFETAGKILLLGFLVNMPWEVLHSALYTTCYQMPFQKYTRLITTMSFKDGVWMSVFYLISYFLFGEINILNSLPQTTFFFILALSFSFIDEKISLRMKRWEYNEHMPRIGGVGITPFLEIGVTGLVTFFLLFNIF